LHFISKCEMWFEKCDSNLFFAEIVWNDSFSWSCLIISSSIFFDSSSLIFNEWRMLILDYRVTYVCSRFVERRLWWNVKLDEAFHQIWKERFIKLDENDSSNLMSENVISSNLTKAIHQTWWRHFIKSNERVISSNFWKERQFFYFLMNNLLQRHLMKKT
jgi:hypothetical protein